MNNKRKGQPGLVGRKIRHRDGTVQTHHVKDGSQTKSQKADRDALRANRPVAKPTVDADALRDAVAFDDYDNTAYYNAKNDPGRFEYVSESVEVHGGARPKVILRRDVSLFVRDEYDASNMANPADNAFARGDREVSDEDVQDEVNTSFDYAKDNAEQNWSHLTESERFEGLRGRVADSAAAAGFDLDDVEVEEVENIEVHDERGDLKAEAQEYLDAHWAEADEEQEDAEPAYGSNPHAVTGSLTEMRSGWQMAALKRQRERVSEWLPSNR